MKITIEATTQMSRSPFGGTGWVWEGETDLGTPIKALVSGLTAGSDDPQMVQRFDAEHDALLAETEPKPGDICPDCGEPIETHHKTVIGELPLPEDGLILAEVKIDMHEVIARWIMAYGGDRGVPIPEGEVTPEELARALRTKMPLVDKPYHDALVKAANAATQYICEQICEQIMAANGISLDDGIGEPIGHA